MIVKQIAISLFMIKSFLRLRLKIKDVDESSPVHPRGQIPDIPPSTGISLIDTR
nr:MAG TPA: hypothetical protein [Bacteriophage sp.]